MSAARVSSGTTVLLAVALTAAAVTACARTPETAAAAQPSNTAAATNAAPLVAAQAVANGGAAVSANPLPLVIVHKSASCGCCGLWVEHMEQAGFPVQVRNLDNLNPIKERLGVPLGKGSCHTAEVDGYFVEGHVPAEDVKRLLAEKPAAKGLVLPGMPAGSPGMEMPDGRVQPYVVELVGDDGNSEAFSQHGH